LGKGLSEFHGNGNVDSVILADGTKLDADMVLLGMGMRPNTELAKGGLVIAEDGGIFTDSHQQTSKSGVFCAGDVCSVPYKYTG